MGAHPDREKVLLAHGLKWMQVLRKAMVKMAVVETQPPRILLTKRKRTKVAQMQSAFFYIFCGAPYRG